MFSPAALEAAYMPEDSKRVIDQRLVKAVAHPLRVEILETLVSEGELSPALIARKLGRPPGNVSYHVNVLRDCEVLELVRTEPRRGALEHYYRPAESIRGFIDLALAAFSLGSRETKRSEAKDDDQADLDPRLGSGPGAS
jgi:DNA-binding transcriptional ArsR family regulator